MTARKLAVLFLAMSFVFVACAAKKKAASVAVSTEPATVATEPAPSATPEVSTPSEPLAESSEATPEESVPDVSPEELVPTTPEATVPGSVYVPEITLEAPPPPEAKLAKFRSFWLGMTIENWARTALGPAKMGSVEQATAESNVATPEANVAEPPKPKVKSKPVYRRLPLVVDEPGVTRFVYTDPADVGIDHITFRFFKDRLDAMEIFYRTGYFDGVILSDFLTRIKEVYGDPKSEEWTIEKERGTLTWDDGIYSVKLTIFNARPFSLALDHPSVREEERAYAEELKKAGSAKKVERLKF